MRLIADREKDAPIGQVDFADSRGQVFFVQFLYPLQLPPQRLHHDCGKHRYPVLAAFSIPHQDLVALEVDVFHSQTQTLKNAQP